MILEGEVDIQAPGKGLQTLHSGGMFGEMALVDGEPVLAGQIVRVLTTGGGGAMSSARNATVNGRNITYPDGKKLFLGVSDPTNLHAIDEVKFATSLGIEAIVVEDDKLQKLITELPSVSDVTSDLALPAGEKKQMMATFAACAPLGPCWTSNSTLCPSLSVERPAFSTAEI